jgi:hypothetical protein
LAHVLGGSAKLIDEMWRPRHQSSGLCKDSRLVNRWQALRAAKSTMRRRLTYDNPPFNCT